jgi:hypothetical protein
LPGARLPQRGDNCTATLLLTVCVMHIVGVACACADWRWRSHGRRSGCSMVRLSVAYHHRGGGRVGAAGGAAVVAGAAGGVARGGGAAVVHVREVLQAAVPSHASAGQGYGYVKGEGGEHGNTATAHDRTHDTTTHNA